MFIAMKNYSFQISPMNFRVFDFKKQTVRTFFSPLDLAERPLARAANKPLKRPFGQTF
jgi:hypothetical protein